MKKIALDPKRIAFCQMIVLFSIVGGIIYLTYNSKPTEKRGLRQLTYKEESDENVESDENKPADDIVSQYFDYIGEEARGRE